MCGVSGIASLDWLQAQFFAMVQAQHHRGLDASNFLINLDGIAGLGHNRLSIVGFFNARHQTIVDASRCCRIIIDCVIHNFIELCQKLTDYQFISRTILNFI
jgi:asparagine synthetase B (glutamine-hydrolysing)